MSSHVLNRIALITFLSSTRADKKGTWLNLGQVGIKKGGASNFRGRAEGPPKTA